MKYIKFLILFISITVFSQSGKVIKVKDGDTVVVIDSLNNKTTIRLAEVDCPESGQAFGNKAKDFTISQVAMKNISYEVVTIDRYGRTVAKIFYDGKYLSKEIIKNGFGWHYKKYSKSKELASLEEQAKEKKIGLWYDNNPIAPWKYREQKRQTFGSKNTPSL